MSGRVAVIAVHGVADQLPFATARATADLLKCRLGDEVSGFREEKLRLEVQPVRAPSQAAAQQSPTTQQQNLATQWTAGAKLECDKKDQKTKSLTAADIGDERQEILDASHKASQEYFDEQIRDYRQRPDDMIYETVCLSAAVRGKQVDGSHRQIDVYEMYWADLSRVQNGIFHAIEELYYVLFAVCNIGRMELDRSKALFSGGVWWCLRVSEAVAERIVTLLVPLTNACLLLLMVFALPQFLPRGISVEQPFFLVSLGLVAGSLGGVIAFVARSKPKPVLARTYLWRGIGIGLVCGGLISLLSLLDDKKCIHIVLMGLLWSGCAAVLLWLSRKYNSRQPGALQISRILAAFVFIAVVGEAIHRKEQPTFSALDIGLTAAEWTLVGLTLMWFTYLIAAVACSVLGFIAVWMERKKPLRHKTAKRVVWTANLAILAPGLLCLVLNLGIWKAALVASGSWTCSLFPPGLQHTPICPHKDYLCVAESLKQLDRIAFFHGESQQQPPCEDVAMKTRPATPSEPNRGISVNRMPYLLVHNAALPMIVVVVALALMLLSAGWLLLPAVQSEGAAVSDSEDMYAQQLGNSLSNAWKGLRIGAELFVRVPVILLVAVCGSLLAYSPPAGPDSFDLKSWLYMFSGPAMGAMGALFVAFATGAIQYTGLRTVIDVAADVANWLRLHPTDNNPTSRISARYVSLLRYVAQRKKDDSDEPYYERVVIFAHSLGSLITVDLLQFLKNDLKHRDDPMLRRIHDDKLPVKDKLPVLLFTHGCPLRQLLGLRFPLTYGWAWHGSAGWHANKEPAGEQLLGVKEWVNAYCSGDYVGRHLWHDDVSNTPWGAIPMTNHEACKANPDTIPRVELCVGAGAHVHYWDPEPKAGGVGTTASPTPSTKVANELLRLIKG